MGNQWLAGVYRLNNDCDIGCRNLSGFKRLENVGRQTVGKCVGR
jgi:hypothetical protein